MHMMNANVNQNDIDALMISVEQMFDSDPEYQADKARIKAQEDRHRAEVMAMTHEQREVYLQECAASWAQECARDE
jgi:hypothetical protein